MVRVTVLAGVLASIIGSGLFVASAQAQSGLGTATPVPPPPVVVVPGGSNGGPVLVQPVPPAGSSGMVLPAPAGGATALPPPRGRFRLIAIAFKVRHQTRDDSLERDGPGDEIMIRADALPYDAHGALQRTSSAHTPVFGAPGHTDIVAGSAVPGFSAAADVGGLRTGDVYAGHSRAPIPIGDLPFVLWEGTLERGQNAFVLVPSIWEMDGGGPSPAQRDWDRGMARDAAGAAPRMASIVGGAPLAGNPIDFSFLTPFVVYDDGDRPIGARPHLVAFPAPGQPLLHQRGMSLPALVLTFDRAQQIAARPESSFDGLRIPAGGLVVGLQDVPEMEGDYLLVLRLVRAD